jgi:hypothetical protein
MVARAQREFGVKEGLSWVTRAFDEVVLPTASFDAVICTGNSLALVKDAAAAAAALRQLCLATCPGGILVIHLLNFKRLPDGPILWQKSKLLTLSRTKVFALKGVHRSGEQGFVDLVVTDAGSGAMLHNESVPFIGMDQAMLEEFLRTAGAEDIRSYGDYQGEAYDSAKSVDLILTAKRREDF